MTEVGVPDADAEFDASGGGGAGGDRRQDAAFQRVLGKPDRGEAIVFGGLGQRHAVRGREAAVQPDTQSWKISRHVPADLHRMSAGGLASLFLLEGVPER